MNFEQFLAKVREALGMPEGTNVAETIKGLAELNRRVDEIKAGAEKRQTETDAIVEELQGRLQRSERLVSGQSAGLRVDREGRIVPAIGDRTARTFQAILRTLVPNPDPKWIEEARDLNFTTGSQGGHLVPTEESQEFLQLVTLYGQAMQIFRSIPMNSAGPLTLPALDGEMSTFWISEGSAPTESYPTFKQFSITNKILGALTHLSIFLIRDSNPSAMQIVLESMARAFAKEIDHIGFEGKSVADGGSDEYTGLFNLTTAVDVSLSSGKTSIENIGFKDLLTAINSMPTPGLVGAEWLMQRTILSVFEGKTDSQGRALLREPGGSNTVSTLYGYPVRLVEYAPRLSTDGAAKPFIVFANPRYMAIGDRQDLEIAQDSSVGFKNALVYVRGLTRKGFAPTNPEAIVRILTAAS